MTIRLFSTRLHNSVTIDRYGWNSRPLTDGLKMYHSNSYVQKFVSLLLKGLHRVGVTYNKEEPVVITQETQIAEQSILDFLKEMRGAIDMLYRYEADTLIVGPREFQEFRKEAYTQAYHFSTSFPLCRQTVTSLGKYQIEQRVIGLTVHVLPWAKEPLLIHSKDLKPPVHGVGLDQIVVDDIW